MSVFNKYERCRENRTHDPLSMTALNWLRNINYFCAIFQVKEFNGGFFSKTYSVSFLKLLINIKGQSIPVFNLSKWNP